MSGIAFIIIAMLLIQLIFLLLAVAYNMVASEYLFLKNIQWIFKYLLGVPIFVAIMFIGGYITTSIAQSKSIINNIIVGSVVVVSMMWSALANAELTLSGVVISLVMMGVVIFGGAYPKR